MREEISLQKLGFSSKKFSARQRAHLYNADRTHLCIHQGKSIKNGQMHHSCKHGAQGKAQVTTAFCLEAAAAGSLGNYNISEKGLSINTDYFFSVCYRPLADDYKIFPQKLKKNKKHTLRRNLWCYSSLASLPLKHRCWEKHKSPCLYWRVQKASWFTSTCQSPFCFATKSTSWANILAFKLLNPHHQQPLFSSPLCPLSLPYAAWSHPLEGWSSKFASWLTGRTERPFSPVNSCP